VTGGQRVSSFLHPPCPLAEAARQGLRAGLEALAPIGRDPGTGGYWRFSWTPEDQRLRAWFAARAEASGMAHEQDGNGNLWAWWGDPAAGGAIATGSHLDSVPGGGPYDGPLGVVSGFVALDLLRARGVPPARPLAVVAWCEEEGGRFGVACLGSRLATGAIDPDQARALTDPGGLTLARAMREAGADPGRLGPDPERLGHLAAFVELHVEQGRGLGQAVGVGSAIWPHGRWRMGFQGTADHAGTTRLPDRHDPMLPLAQVVLATRSAAASHQALGTVGRVVVEPNATNGVAGKVSAWLDARAPDQGRLNATVEVIRQVASRAAAEHGVGLDFEQESFTPRVELDAGLRRRARQVLGGVPEVETGAGHDAAVLASALPTAMLFVRNPTGVSHSPAEAAGEDDCVAGVLALAGLLEDLSR